MDIEIIKESGCIDAILYKHTPDGCFYFEDSRTPFYYNKVFLVDGVKLYLGSTQKGKSDTLTEAHTGAKALSKEDVQSKWTLENVKDVLERKIRGHPCNNLHDVIAFYQNNYSIHKLQLWQINLTF